MHFAAVHDSYWTHACDIEEMHSILREQVENINFDIISNSILTKKQD